MSEAPYAISSMKTVGAFLNGRACSDTLFHVLNRAYGQPQIDEERAAMPLAGGIIQHGYQCGMLWGATLAAGAQAYRRFGKGPQAEARSIIAGQRLVESFHGLNNNTNCLEITGIDNSSSTIQMFTYFLIKGGTIGCFRMAAKYAPAAFREINCAMSEEHAEAPAAPASCSALLAQKMGVSDMHAVMAAGLAGGIGLSGGACGALGAALWITGLNILKQGARKLDYKSPSTFDIIDRFLKNGGYEFECSKIVGRRFESIEDHAEHVRSGGCANLLDALAAG
ncbi:MAG: C-GCAxxG-C-C family protein [Proteobacteria bacterium]|nr:C-GCAxxG-C-C family protein [Pseudomonadota bacterium]MBU1596016.1 C-GCAxxG-C-C family protein [Pseudomonadota bacterium]